MAQMTVRARAVDMLGRQQIAGIPTAIHELFKNAHDAYADHAEIDYFRDEKMLILRDDGIGMTEDDFNKKWLTIGTESKLGENRNTGYVPKDKKPRAIMGEKGIGRLAIAAIGRQVIVLTRAVREDGYHDMVAALIHWSFFEIPGINISDIVIPTKTFPEGVLPTEADLFDLAEELKECLNDLSSVIPKDIRGLILSDLDFLNFSPEIVFSNLKGSKSLNGLHHGTHFIITHVDEVLENDIDDESDDSASEIQKILVGFSNNMYSESHDDNKNDSVNHKLKTLFRDHKPNKNKPDEIIQDSFFTKEEFMSADHHIEGEFDEYGQFKGNVSVYGSEPKSHYISWNGNFSSKTRCGPFKIKFAYIQGKVSDTKMPSEQHALLKAKLSKIGGLYIYKDGIRVLPYGGPDVDFLEIERRRTKNLGDAFFSHRLIFGALETTHSDNSELIEKAGREGFRQNKAYRQFKDILINFLTQLAKDFFREDSSDNTYHEVKSKLSQEHKIQTEALKRRNKLVSEKKKAFSSSLNNFFDRLSNNYFVGRVNKIKSYFNSEFETLEVISNKEDAFVSLLDLESKVKRMFSNLEYDLVISKPNVGLSKDAREDWETYLKCKDKLFKEELEPLKNEIDLTISNYIKENELTFNKRLRIESNLENDKAIIDKKSKLYKKEINSAFEVLEKTINDKVKSKASNLQQEMEKVIYEFNRTPVDLLPEEDIRKKTIEWEERIKKTQESADIFFSKLRDTIESIVSDVKDGDISSIDTISALENINEDFKESLENYYDFAQLGMSIGIIQHEFGSTARSVRQAIKDLKPWAELNPELDDLYNYISTNFHHLDGYLTLFTPLNRRLYRTKIELSGYEIVKYMDRVFGERLKRHKIDLVYTTEFESSKIETYPSTILPVFINTIDNAIHWLDWYNIPEPKIKLDRVEDGFTIENNGRGIDIRDASRIFDFGYTLKENGRGMGLYISKQALNREGYDLELLTIGKESMPKFLLKFDNKE